MAGGKVNLGFGGKVNLGNSGGNVNLGFGSKGKIGGRQAKTVAPTPVHHGGGFLHDIGGVAHAVGSDLGKAGHDIEAMPGGTYQAFKASEHDSAKLASHLGAPGAARLGAGPYQTPALGKAMAKQTYESIRHPLRDPFQGLLTVGAIASLGAGGVARAGAAADAADAADEAGAIGKAGAAAKALAHKPLMPTRELHVPTVVKDAETGDLKVVHQPVHLVESHAPLARAAQALHDKILQRALDNNLTAEKASRTARYAMRRVGKANAEEGRIGEYARGATNKKLSSIKHFDKGLARKDGQLAIFLRSANVLPHEAASFWKAQHGVGEDTADLARTANRLHQKGVLRVGADGKVEVNAEKFPQLAKADELTKSSQAIREDVIREHGFMSPAGIETRKNLVAEKVGLEGRKGQGYTNLSISDKRSAGSNFARSRSAKIPKPQKLAMGKEATGSGIPTGKIPDDTTGGVARSTGQALRYLTTREHRSLVYRYGSDVKRTGDDVLVADPSAAKLGEIPVKTKQLLGLERSTLNTIPGDEESGLADAMKAKLEDMLPRTASKQAAKIEDDAGLGTEAPQGYRWVPKQMAQHLFEETTPRGRIERGADKINAAVTSFTVYLKLSHIPQRGITDATTSLLSGSLRPKAFRAAIELRKELTENEFDQAAATTGVHGYSALPAEGDSKIAHLAREGVKVKGRTVLPGSQFYAHTIDAPFRFLNLANEARKAGLGDAENFRKLLAAAKDPATATPRELSVLKRANRVSMMYDGLGAAEKRYIARALWFYPWTKASARFAGHTITEHPLVSAVGGALGAEGVKAQKSLGPLPYYEFGLTPLHGNTVSDMSRLSPFTTGGDLLQIPQHPEQVRQNFNPAYSAVMDLLTGTNSFGEKQNRGTAALADLTSPTPEAQILNALRASLGKKSNKPSTKMFPNSGEWAGIHDPLMRAIFGAEYPRKVNKEALKKATEKWKTISFPAP